MRLESLDELVQFVEGLPLRSMVGIVGPPGAGKSTVAAALVSRVPGAALLPMDGYHYPQAELRRLGRRERMGAPDTFDVPAFVDVLRRIRAVPALGNRAPSFGSTPSSARSGPSSFRNDGTAVLARGFDRDNEEPVPDAVAILPSFRKLVVEGNYLLVDSGGWEEVAPLLDATLYLEVDDDIRLSRLIARHIAFGKSPDAARAWALGPDEANARLIAATAPRADHVLALD